MGEEEEARRALDANRQRIEGTARGTPAGRSYSRSTTAKKGYKLIKAQYASTCIDCGKAIKAGTEVRYWFGDGISCRFNCTSKPT